MIRRTSTYIAAWLPLVAIALAPFVAGCNEPPAVGAKQGAEQDDKQKSDKAADAGKQDPAETPDSTKPNEPIAADATAENPKDPYAIADDASTQDLVAFIVKTMNTQPAGESREEMIANYVKGQRAVSDAASRILADKEAKDEAAMAMQVKIRAMQALEQLADEDAAAEKKKLVELYKDDPRDGIGEMIGYLDLSARMGEVFNDDADPKAAAAALIKEIDKDKGSNPLISEMFKQYAQSLEYRDAYAEAAQVYTKLYDKWSKSEDPRLKMSADQFEAIIKRLALFGKEIDLEGDYLDGSALDWRKYRGKYVLVDFWATWCGPCIHELPNVLENYEKYHDKGFDVLAISLDGSQIPEKEAITQNRATVATFMKDRELPWKTLYSEDPNATGWKHPMAARFGISGIPFAMLVDPEGKVLSFNARGPALGEMLAKHLGPVDTKDTLDAKDTDPAVDGPAPKVEPSEPDPAAEAKDEAPAKAKTETNPDTGAEN